MTSIGKFASAVALIAVCSTVSAQQIPPPSCSTPAQPAYLDTTEQINAFAQKVETYQKCLMSYSEKQKAIGDRYAAAANSAIKMWNDFVKQLNTGKFAKKK